MSANGHTPLFALDNEDKLIHEEDPTVILARKNLITAEQVQQEHAEQR